MALGAGVGRALALLAFIVGITSAAASFPASGNPSASLVDVTQPTAWYCGPGTLRQTSCSTACPYFASISDDRLRQVRCCTTTGGDLCPPSNVVPDRRCTSRKPALTCPLAAWSCGSGRSGTDCDVCLVRPGTATQRPVKCCTDPEGACNEVDASLCGWLPKPAPVCRSDASWRCHRRAVRCVADVDGRWEEVTTDHCPDPAPALDCSVEYGCYGQGESASQATPEKCSCELSRGRKRIACCNARTTSGRCDVIDEDSCVAAGLPRPAEVCQATSWHCTSHSSVTSGATEALCGSCLSGPRNVYCCPEGEECSADTQLGDQACATLPKPEEMCRADYAWHCHDAAEGLFTTAACSEPPECDSAGSQLPAICCLVSEHGGSCGRDAAVDDARCGADAQPAACTVPLARSSDAIYARYWACVDGDDLDASCGCSTSPRLSVCYDTDIGIVADAYCKHRQRPSQRCHRWHCRETTSDDASVAPYTLAACGCGEDDLPHDKDVVCCGTDSAHCSRAVEDSLCAGWQPRQPTRCGGEHWFCETSTPGQPFTREACAQQSPQCAAGGDIGDQGTRQVICCSGDGPCAPLSARHNATTAAEGGAGCEAEARPSQMCTRSGSWRCKDGDGAFTEEACELCPESGLRELRCCADGACEEEHALPAGSCPVARPALVCDNGYDWFSQDALAPAAVAFREANSAWCPESGVRQSYCCDAALPVCTAATAVAEELCAGKPRPAELCDVGCVVSEHDWCSGHGSCQTVGPLDATLVAGYRQPSRCVCMEGWGSADCSLSEAEELYALPVHDECPAGAVVLFSMSILGSLLGMCMSAAKARTSRGVGLASLCLVLFMFIASVAALIQCSVAGPYLIENIFFAAITTLCVTLVGVCAKFQYDTAKRVSRAGTHEAAVMRREMTKEVCPVLVTLLVAIAMLVMFIISTTSTVFVECPLETTELPAVSLGDTSRCWTCPDCGEHGVCLTERGLLVKATNEAAVRHVAKYPCVCDEGWTGPQCSIPCPAGMVCESQQKVQSVLELTTTVKPCPEGYYCEEGMPPQLCPEGVSGAAVGLSSAACAGPCAPGSYCPGQSSPPKPCTQLGASVLDSGRAALPACCEGGACQYRWECSAKEDGVYSVAGCDECPARGVVDMLCCDSFSPSACTNSTALPESACADSPRPPLTCDNGYDWHCLNVITNEWTTDECYSCSPVETTKCCATDSPTCERAVDSRLCRHSPVPGLECGRYFFGCTPNVTTVATKAECDWCDESANFTRLVYCCDSQMGDCTADTRVDEEMCSKLVREPAECCAISYRPRGVDIQKRVALTPYMQWVVILSYGLLVPLIFIVSVIVVLGYKRMRAATRDVNDKRKDTPAFKATQVSGGMQAVKVMDQLGKYGPDVMEQAE